MDDVICYWIQIDVWSNEKTVLLIETDILLVALQISKYSGISSLIMVIFLDIYSNCKVR